MIYLLSSVGTVVISLLIYFMVVKCVDLKESWKQNQYTNKFGKYRIYQIKDGNNNVWYFAEVKVGHLLGIPIYKNFKNPPRDITIEISRCRDGKILWPENAKDILKNTLNILYKEKLEEVKANTFTKPKRV